MTASHAVEQLFWKTQPARCTLILMTSRIAGAVRKGELMVRNMAFGLPRGCRSAWSGLVAWNERCHVRLHEKWPRTVASASWLLHGFYGFAVSPAFAVILSLLLVGLVISGVVPVIVSISVFAAWLIAILSVARYERIGRLRIPERLIVVVAIAALLAMAANRYVRWCLQSYAKTQPTPIVAKSDDKLAYERFKDLMETEVAKFKLIPTQAPHTTKPPFIVDLAPIVSTPDRDNAFMALAPTAQGDQVFPIEVAGEIIFTNGDHAVLISNYYVEARTADGKWVRLLRVDSAGKQPFLLNFYQPTRSALATAKMVAIPTLDVQIYDRSIAPHEALKGWIFCQYPSTRKPMVYAGKWRVVFTDTAGERFITPDIPGKSILPENSPQAAPIQVLAIVDLSSKRVTYLDD